MEPNHEASINNRVELDKAGILHASVAEAELDKVTIVSRGSASEIPVAHGPVARSVGQNGRRQGLT